MFQIRDCTTVIDLNIPRRICMVTPVFKFLLCNNAAKCGFWIVFFIFISWWPTYFHRLLTGYKMLKETHLFQFLNSFQLFLFLFLAFSSAIARVLPMPSRDVFRSVSVDWRNSLSSPLVTFAITFLDQNLKVVSSCFLIPSILSFGFLVDLIWQKFWEYLQRLCYISLLLPFCVIG